MPTQPAQYLHPHWSDIDRAVQEYRTLLHAREQRRELRAQKDFYKHKCQQTIQRLKKTQLMGSIELTSSQLLFTSAAKPFEQIELTDFKLPEAKVAIASRIIYVSPDGRTKVLKERAPRKVLVIGQKKDDRNDRIK